MKCRVIKEFTYQGVRVGVGSIFEGTDAECYQYREFLDCSQESSGGKGPAPEQPPDRTGV